MFFLCKPLVTSFPTLADSVGVRVGVPGRTEVEEKSLEGLEFRARQICARHHSAGLSWMLQSPQAGLERLLMVCSQDAHDIRPQLARTRRRVWCRRTATSACGTSGMLVELAGVVFSSARLRKTWVTSGGILDSKLGLISCGVVR